MEILYQPFGWILRTLFDLFGNYMFALAFIALILKLALLPSSISQQKGSAKQTRLAPKIRRIKEKYKDDKDAQRKIQEEQQALYQREGFNPMNQGCLPLVIQMPIIFGLYGVIYKPLTYTLQIAAKYVESLTTAYNSIVSSSADAAEATSRAAKTASRAVEILIIDNVDKLRAAVTDVPEAVLDKIAEFGREEFTFLGVSLGATPSFDAENKLILIIPALALITSLATALVSFLKQKKQNPEMASNASMGCMTFGMPLFSLWLTFQMPAGIGVYWIINNILSFVQTLVLNYTHSNEKIVARVMVEETIERRSKEANSKLVAAKKHE